MKIFVHKSGECPPEIEKMVREEHLATEHSLGNLWIVLVLVVATAAIFIGLYLRWAY